MPLVINSIADQSMSLEDFVESLYSNKTDPTCHESLKEAADNLKKLSNDKTFLGNLISKELKNYNKFQTENTYSSQVIMLHAPSKDSKFFVRANIWPSKEDYLTLINGEDAFFYHKPHDHNFNFLTVGYFGTGYWSDYYEYDYDKVIGYKGENVNLIFKERSNLSQGKVMLYRAHLDVHDQLPADDFSISINIMENSIKNPLLDQYAFDIEKSKIKSIINSNSTKALFDVAVNCGTDNSLDIIQHIADNHLIQRVRLNAIDSIAKNFDSKIELIKFYEKYVSDNSIFIRENISIKLKELGKVI